VSALFESVHTMTDYYDGPVRGVADYCGRPHLYEARWDDVREEFGPRFQLSPLDDATRDLAIEDWAIWLRWEAAFKAGLVDQASHPALPSERARHVELQAELATRLVVDPARAFIMCGEFRWIPRPPCWPLAEVRWYDPALLDARADDRRSGDRG
jgi:hypothetical protein